MALDLKRTAALGIIKLMKTNKKDCEDTLQDSKIFEKYPKFNKNVKAPLIPADSFDIIIS